MRRGERCSFGTLAHKIRELRDPLSNQPLAQDHEAGLPPLRKGPQVSALPGSSKAFATSPGLSLGVVGQPQFLCPQRFERPRGCDVREPSH